MYPHEPKANFLKTGKRAVKLCSLQFLLFFLAFLSQQGVKILRGGTIFASVFYSAGSGRTDVHIIGV